MRTRNALIVALALAAGSVFSTVAIVGCANVDRIDGTGPGGIGGSVKFQPSTAGERSLPSGFKPCGQDTTKARLNDGSTTDVSVCVFCSENPRDLTVYVQHNCRGEYFRGQRTPTPQTAPAPRSVPLDAFVGKISPERTTVEFVIREPIIINPGLLRGNSSEILISGFGRQDLIQMQGIEFPAGTEVKINGTSLEVADHLFWMFGVGVMKATTDTGLPVKVQIGQVHYGPVMIVDIAGTRQGAVLLPWRGGR